MTHDSEQSMEPREPVGVEQTVTKGNTTIIEGGEATPADKDLLAEFSSDVDYIDLNHLRITSLKDLGLSRFKALKEICLRQNLLTNMIGLEDLPADLEALDLYDNRLEHMDRRLEGFGSAMTSLDLSFNNFRHIKHLENVTGLTDLYLCQNAINRISGLENLTNLTQLELGANKIREIKGLDSLVNLEKLWLARNKISKIQGLDKLRNLKLLSIQSNRITQIEGLENLENLQELYISHNGITEIKGLENNHKLTTLDVGSNRIEKLSGVKHLGELVEFWGNGNQLSSFPEIEDQLGDKKDLETVYFEHNPLQRQNPAAYHTKLKLILPNLQQIDANPVRHNY